MKSLKKGFTLVELMVVIVIIGILAALAIPRFMGATNKTKATEFKTVLKSINTLQNAYRQERDRWGSAADTIGADLPKATTATTNPGTARFLYDVQNPGATTGVVGAAQTTADGILKTVSGADISATDSRACISDAAVVTVASNNMSTLTTLPSGCDATVVAENNN